MDESSLKIVKTGLIGYGKMGMLHGAIINSLPNTKLVAICDTEKMINNFLKQNLEGISIYSDYLDMLEKAELDAVFITTPVFLHYPMVSEVLRHNNISIFIEKPLAMTYGQCKDILKINKNKSNTVGYCRRFLPTYNHMKKVLCGGELGKPMFFETNLFVDQVHRPIESWLYSKQKSGGGVLMDLGCHAIDIIHYILGDIKSVYANNVDQFKPDIEDASIINIKLNNNLIGYLCISWSKFEYRMAELSLKVNCEKGWICATEKNVEIYSTVDGQTVKKGYNFITKQQLQKPVFVDIGGPEYTTEDIEFIDCIISKTPSKCSFEEATKVSKVIENIYQSASTDKSVNS